MRRQRLAAWAGRLGGRLRAGRLRHGGRVGPGGGSLRRPGLRRGADLRGPTGSALLGFLYLFVFSLGLTALLVAVGLSSGTLAALPAAGRWTRLDQARRGALLLLMAEYYFVRMGSVL